MTLTMEPAIHAADDSASNRRFPGCPAGCLTIIVIGMLVLAIVVLAGPRLASRFYFRRHLSPAESAKYDERIYKQLTIPAAWLTPASVPAHVRRGMENLQTSTTAYMGVTTSSHHLFDPALRDAFVALQHGDAISDEAWSTITKVVAGSSALVQVTSQTIRLPGYDLSTGDEAYLGAAVGVAHHRLGSLACLAAHLTAREGKYGEALDLAILPMREAQGHPPRDLMTGLSGWHLIRLGSDCIADIATSTTDRAALRRTLDELIALRSNVVAVTGLPIPVLHAISRMRWIAADGYPVSIIQGKSAVRYFSQYLSATVGYANYKIPKLPIGSSERNSLERTLRNLDTRRELHVSLNTALAICEMAAPDQLVFKLIDMESQAPQEEEIVAAERYDLAVLRVATRLAEIDGLTSVTSQKMLVPAYLPHEFMDPANGAPYQWHAPTRQFYGVGPDRMDDKLAVHYESYTQLGDVAVPGPLPAVPAYTPSSGAFYHYGKFSYFPPGL
ncbi:MAG: hypothetical protein ACR2IE_17405 [Candidatus Sumerlaeaceae bacterium]